MVFHSEIVVKEQVRITNENSIVNVVDNVTKSAKTTIPFMKDNEFDYQNLTQWMGIILGNIGGYYLF